MTIQIDTREKARAIQLIKAEFARQGVETITSKLWVGDYARLDNLTTVIDRKQNLNELAGNIIEKRFHDEIKRAYDHGVKIIFLIEHGPGVTDLIDVLFWENPRIKDSPRCISGEHLYKSMNTLTDRYGV
ncbi:MAG: ERCC4 domain-containing protein, partial [Clostridia bacterium]|nr:ERCC4 domain-containing protein [Clostridia bacterium]